MYSVIDNIIHRDSCKKAQKKISVGAIATAESEYLSAFVNIDGVKACRCCEKAFKALRGVEVLQQRLNTYYKYLTNYAEHYGYSCEINSSGDLILTTNVEKWIIHVIKLISDEDMTAKVCFYHRNAFMGKSAVKCGNADYPEYHIQFTKVITPFEIVNYAVGHEVDKYGVTVAEEKGKEKEGIKERL